MMTGGWLVIGFTTSRYDFVAPNMLELQHLVAANNPSVTLDFVA
jgi:hypothetical protein